MTKIRNKIVDFKLNYDFVYSISLTITLIITKCLMTSKQYPLSGAVSNKNLYDSPKMNMFLAPSKAYSLFRAQEVNTKYAA